MHATQLKMLLVTTAFVVTVAGSPALADPGHVHGKDASYVAGEPGDPAKDSRIVNVTMIEHDDGTMAYEPLSIDVQQGEQVKFITQNKGEVPHEFMLANEEENLEHAALMQKYPEMEHDQPNAVTLQPGAKTELVWRFSKGGSFEFACLIPGHRELGMLGQVSVEGDAAAAEPDASDSDAAETSPSPTSDEWVDGTVTKIDKGAGKITIRHAALKAFEMKDGMTMVFKAADPTMVDQVAAGDAVRFVPDRIRGQFTVTKIEKSK